MTPELQIRLLRIGLTITAMEFFGPVVRDAGASHAMNPHWVGHARLHLVWLLGFMLLSGIVNLYFIWFRRPVFESLRLSALWQGCNLGGFWISVLLMNGYGGSVTMEGIHVEIFGMDENVFGFSLLTLLLGAVWFGLVKWAPANAERAA